MPPAWTIGWQEILMILLFLVGIIFIPYPLRRLQRGRAAPARWSSRIRVGRIDTIHEVAEAFFCSYSEGEYALTVRERFRMTFHRGQWRRTEGGLTAAGSPADDVEDMPVILRLLFQPRPDSLLITMKHEAHLDAALPGAVRKALTTCFKREVRDFEAYLRNNFGAKGGFLPGKRPSKRIDATWKSR
jgi:hypothetical protein